MTGLQTNIFPITNLNALSSEYRLFGIRGLRPERGEYFQNAAAIKRKLSYQLKSPVTIIHENGGAPQLVVRADAAESVPPSLVLTGCVVRFEPQPDTFLLDYTLRTADNDEICLRFLQFLIQEPLHRHPNLWQTAAGRPFFFKKPVWSDDRIEHFEGFSVRVVTTPEGGLGLAVDVANRFVSKKPLPSYLDRNQFHSWKGRNLIYRYGHQWFEIQAESLGDFNVSEHDLVVDGRAVPLMDFIMNATAKPIPPELAQLPHDASVVLYRNNRGEERAAPTPLCFRTFDTHTEEAALVQGRTILPPQIRYARVCDFVRSHLGNLRFGNTRLCLSNRPVVTQHRMFAVPDLEFGNGQILSVRGTPNAHQVSLDKLGEERVALMLDAAAGFYERDPLERQYFLMPQSVFDSYGPTLIADLKRTVNALFPHGKGYEPVVVPYDDRKAKTYPQQGKAIMETADARCKQSGYAVVMIHNTTDRRHRKEDQLAAMVTRELRQIDIVASVMHTAVSQECYEMARGNQGKPCYRVKDRARGKFSGYLRGVALNCVLLTNQRWPFALATPLHADLIIGIDVKHNAAGFLAVGSNGASFRRKIANSRQKEQLLPDQVRAYFAEIVRDESLDRSAPLRNIVVQRDGRLFPGEREGLKAAFADLKREGILPADATLTLIEIPKSSPVPLRLFDVSQRGGGTWVDNPQVGAYYLATENDGYVCTTGRAFRRRGTVRPLHVRRLEGAMSLENCLEDVYALSVLAWTRPEDCTRDPITTKLNDRFLGEAATEYDRDALEFVRANNIDIDEEGEDNLAPSEDDEEEEGQ